ncbi:MAG TPA: TraB/GumN family protein [Allosphingosinicella sp.]|jgi:hypothetical protein
MKKLLLAAALAAVSAPALSHAQAAPEAPAPAAAPAAPAAPRPDADPALWVLRDADTTIYLFGTFHLLDGRRDWFNDEVRTAFDRSDELVLEILLPENQADMEPIMTRYAAPADGRTLSQRLPAALHARLAAALDGVGLPAAAFERTDPWFPSMMLAVLGARRIGITGEHGAEGTLSAAARARGMRIGTVERIEDQLGAFDGMSEAGQIAQLEQTIAAMDRLGETFGPMTDAWSAGDAERLYTLMNSQAAQSPELHRAIFVERNARWTNWIRERMSRPGTVFMAVGVGHLAGRDSVQAMLARHGLRAARVTQ